MKKIIIVLILLGFLSLIWLSRYSICSLNSPNTTFCGFYRLDRFTGKIEFFGHLGDIERAKDIEYRIKSAR